MYKKEPETPCHTSKGVRLRKPPGKISKEEGQFEEVPTRRGGRIQCVYQ